MENSEVSVRAKIKDAVKNMTDDKKAFRENIEDLKTFFYVPSNALILKRAIVSDSSASILELCSRLNVLIEDRFILDSLGYSSNINETTYSIIYLLFSKKLVYPPLLEKVRDKFKAFYKGNETIAMYMFRDVEHKVSSDIVDRSRAQYKKAREFRLTSTDLKNEYETAFWASNAINIAEFHEFNTIFVLKETSILINLDRLFEKCETGPKTSPLFQIIKPDFDRLCKKIFTGKSPFNRKNRGDTSPLEDEYMNFLHDVYENIDPKEHSTHEVLKLINEAVNNDLDDYRTILVRLLDMRVEIFFITEYHLDTYLARLVLFNYEFIPFCKVKSLRYTSPHEINIMYQLGCFLKRQILLFWPDAEETLFDDEEFNMIYYEDVLFKDIFVTYLRKPMNNVSNK